MAPLLTRLVKQIYSIKKQNKNNTMQCAKINLNKYFIFIYFLASKYTINAVINVVVDTNVNVTLFCAKNLFNNKINESHKSLNIN